MGRVATGSGLVDRLFGPGVAGVVAHLGGDTPEPRYPEEALVVAGAVPRRRYEFLVGRACAHAALAAIGRDDAPIGVGPRRQPRWPAGVVGSIAHGGDWAGAVVASAGNTESAWNIVGLGLDIEPVAPPLSGDVERLVLTAGERRRLPAEPGPATVAAKVAFTAKEAVYKALHPSTGWSLEPADVEIDVDLASGRWHARLHERFPLDDRRLVGRFEVADHHLFAGVVVRVGDGRGRGGGR
ncbi:MAG TPA: 4'-phosphopantetheinyl transferase superfamily protein [Acidimicrobiales bacterium]|nr:4'-phosphopantetheinyl transferase superfamily protein [Acidimicrobiales bacterium]